MIEISRLLALQFRSVCRRLGLRASVNADPAVQFDAGNDGVRLRVLGTNVAVEHILPGGFPIGRFHVPLSAISQIGGTKQTPVTLTPSAHRVRLSWSEGLIPRELDVEMAGELPAEFPAVPANLQPNPIGLHRALRNAVTVADREVGTRYTLNAIKLEGASGRVITTDGHQLLVHSGFTFPWNGDVILPASKVFDAAELTQSDPVAVGRSGDWIAFSFGRWVVYLKHDTEARFPTVDSLLGRPANAQSTLTFHDDDAEFLRRSLDVMPCASDAERAVTVELNGHVAVRSRADRESPPTEVVLSNSQYLGKPARVSCDRRFLDRALKLGFRALYFDAAGSPLYCDDGQRHYLWMPLSAEDEVPAAANTVRIESTIATSRSCPSRHVHRKHSMPQPVHEGHSRSHRGSNATATQATVTDAATVPLPDTKPTVKVRRRRPESQPSTLDQAVAVREILREAFDKSRELVRVIKRHNRQTRLVATTLQSLKELQAVA